MESLTFHPVFSSWLAALLLELTAAVPLFYAIRRDRFAPARRRILAALRIGVLLILAFLLCRPGLDTEITRKLPASLAFLLDTSESMSITDAADGKSRYQSAVSAFQQSNELLRKTDTPFPAPLYGFDEALRPLSKEGETPEIPSEPKGAETAIGEGLDSLLNRFAGNRLLGVVLLSDGAQRSDTLSPFDAALRYRDAGVPIYPICFGTSGSSSARRDVSVSALSVPQRNFVGGEITVTGQVQINGYAKQKVQIVFSMEDAEGNLKPVEQKELSSESDRQTIPFRFTAAADTPGERRLVVSVPPLDGELLKENNQSDAYLQVTDGNIRVLFLEGARRFEDKFIRMALDSTNEISVEYRRLPSGAENTPINRKAIPDLDGYSAVILGDLDPALMKNGELNEIAEAVAGGLGLLVLPGLNTFAGLAQSPLSPLVPVKMDDSGGGSETEKLILDGKFQVRPAPSEANHYLARLSVDAGKSKSAWEKLPPLESVFQTGPAEQGSEVILEGIGDSGKKLPLLASRNYGEGRTAILLSESTWRWASGGFREEFQKFWVQTVLWTAGADRLKAGELDVRADRTSLICGEPAEFRIDYQPAGEKKNGIRTSAELTCPDGKTVSVPVTGEKEARICRYTDTGQPGEYRLRITVDEDGNLKERTVRFSARVSHRELEDPASVPALLQNIAEISGGRLITETERPELLREISQKRESIAERTVVHRSLYDRWTLFAVFTALLTAEWFLRKKWGGA